MATEKRLIDANELMDDKVWLCGGFVGDPYCDGYMEALDKVETVIREFPTVDAVEVVHGEWTVIENDYDCTTTLECSVCGMSFCFEEYDGLLPQAQTYHYCPNCGADMRERE